MPHARQVLRFALIAGGYAIAHQLGYLLRIPPTRIPALWPATGIALGIILLTPRRQLLETVVALCLASVGSSLVYVSSLPVALVFLAANAIETALAAALFWRFRSRTDGGYTGHVIALIATASLPNFLSALPGAAAVVWTFGQDFTAAYVSWWASDGLGMLFMAPLVVSLVGIGDLRAMDAARRVETAVFLTAWTLGAWSVFHGGELFVALPYTMLALLTWAGLRLDVRIVSIALAVLAFVSASSPLVGNGPSPLGGDSLWERVVRMQVFLGVAGAMGLLLAAIRHDVRHALEEAREGRQRLATLADHLPDGVVFQLSADTAPPRVLFLSAGIEEITGVPAEAVLQDAERLFSCIDSHDRAGIPLLQPAGSNPTGQVYRGEVRLSPVTGGRVRCVLISAALRDVAVGRRVWDGIIVDVSEQRDAEAALRDSEERMQRAGQLELVGQLAGGIAHDFNNLLTVIMGQAELLKYQAPSEPVRQAAREIGDTAQRAGQLTQQLLAVGRRLMMTRVECDLNGVVTGIDTLLRTTVGESITVSQALSSAPLAILADPVHLERVVLNLALNARDAMPSGGVLTIATGVHALPEDLARRHGLPAGDYVFLAVSDTGIGMAPDVSARVFEPFFTTKPHGTGVGLGLAAVDGIVRQSGGCIDVTSAVGRGTTFTVFLPALGRTLQSVDIAPALDTAPGHETVLLVEDNESVRMLTERILRMAGYTVMAATGGAEALALVAAHPAIDILLTDVMMPGMSGPELAGRLSEIYPDLHVLFMSGYSNDAMLSQGVAAGEIALIRQPFTAGQLLSWMRQALGDRSRADAAASRAV